MTSTKDSVYKRVPNQYRGFMEPPKPSVYNPTHKRLVWFECGDFYVTAGEGRGNITTHRIELIGTVHLPDEEDSKVVLTISTNFYSGGRLELRDTLLYSKEYDLAQSFSTYKADVILNIRDTIESIYDQAKYVNPNLHLYRYIVEEIGPWEYYIGYESVKL